MPEKRVGGDITGLIKGKKEYKLYNLNQGVFNDHFYFGKLVEFEDQLTEMVFFDDGSGAVDFEKILTESIVVGSRGGKKKVVEPYSDNQIRGLGMSNYLPLMQEECGWSNDSIAWFVELAKKDGVVSEDSAGCRIVGSGNALDTQHRAHTTPLYIFTTESSSVCTIPPLPTLNTHATLETLAPDLLKILIKLQDYYMDVCDTRILLLGAAYTLASYCYTLFDSIGYLFFNSDKESGKTKHANLLGLMSFHTINSSNPSEAALFRVISMGKGLMVIDDFENLPDERKNALNQILKVGYRKEGKTVRVEKKGECFVPAWFDCYCPKIVTNTTTLEPITLSRCIPIHLVKTLSAKGRRYPRAEDGFWQNVRNACHLWAMLHWREVKEVYDGYSCDELNNRDLELVKGLLAVVKSIDVALHDQLLLFLVKCFVDRETVDLTGSIDFVLFDELRCRVSGDGGWVQTKEAVYWLQSRLLADADCEDAGVYRKKVGRSLPTVRYVGIRLSRIPFFRKRRVGAGVEYWLSKKLVEDYMRIKGFHVEKSEEKA